MPPFDRHTAGRDPALWLMLAEMELASGRIEDGRAAIKETLSLDPLQREAIVALGCRNEKGKNASESSDSPVDEPRPAPPSKTREEHAPKADSGVRVSDESAAEQYRLALTYRDLGMVGDAVKGLEIAARSACQRFDACSLLGRLYIEQGHTAKAVEWFERAAEAPAPTPDANRALLYDLAETVENLGEHGRALAVFVELEAESGGYRGVAHRIERLSKAKAKR
jgi:tetratricopeptide (TPR) repeat protein